LALAGIMGGEGSGVSDDTVDVLFECAYFDPQSIAGRARRFGLHTDASHRYERGVDPTGQLNAIERATDLLIGIAGGQAGPLCMAKDTATLPKTRKVTVTRPALDTRLGVVVSDDDVTSGLTRLGFDVDHRDEAWQVSVPPHRFDVSVGEDLVEEIARVYGYERIEAAPEQASVIMPEVTETRVTMARVQDVLVARGLQEVITYSFVDPELHQVVCPDAAPLPLKNPISSDLGVMRASLWPGLLNTVKHNLARQQDRVQVFETGLTFDWQNDTLTQKRHVAFALTGPALPERWSHDRARVDLHDGMGHVEALLALRGARATFDVEAAGEASLHP
ncbi:MAG: phenylalanine--tRNA ligase subunit beta, partial [Pseudomonadota bacterium]